MKNIVLSLWIELRKVKMFRDIKACFSLTKAILLHKWYLLRIGRKFGVSWWRLLKHDLSKFSFSEFFGYAIKFHGMKGDLKWWDLAWAHHKKYNDHHWENWIWLFNIAMKISDQAIREMVADWFASTKWHTGEYPTLDKWAWFSGNYSKVILHEETRKNVEQLIKEKLGGFPNVS